MTKHFLPLVVLLFGTWWAEAGEKRPNFLFIAIDDMNDHFAFLSEIEGNNLKQLYPDHETRRRVLERLSPNIDRFAKTATVFTRAYTAAPVCNPSRVAAMYGVHPNRSGIFGNSQFHRSTPESAERLTLAEALKLGGYHTAGVGKILHSPMPKNGEDWPDAERSWSEWVPKRVGASGPKFETGEPPLRFIGQLDVDLEETEDWINADFIARVLENGSASVKGMGGHEYSIELPDDKPFFLACGIFRPHIPFYVPHEYYEMFPRDELGVTEYTLQSMMVDMEDLPEAGVAMSGLDHGVIKELFEQAMEGKYPGGRLEAFRRMIQGYLASVAYVDDCLGRLFEGLEKSGLADNTIVVLWSDHGWHTASKYTFDKLTLWEPSMKCNLMIRDPRKGGEGQVCDRVVSLLDMYPTIANAAEIEAPDDLQGHDLAPLLENPARQWDYAAMSTFGKGNTGLRVGDWRFIRYRDGSKELYHLSQDPYELINLAGRIDFVGIQKSLEKRLNAVLAGEPALMD